MGKFHSVANRTVECQNASREPPVRLAASIVDVHFDFTEEVGSVEHASRADSVGDQYRVFDALRANEQVDEGRINVHTINDDIGGDACVGKNGAKYPGILGAILTDASVTADIIVDGVHVDPTLVDLFVRAKGVEDAVLITDAISATGMLDGTYLLGEIEVHVHDGRCESNGRLAGSVLTLDRAIRNTVKFAHVSLQDAIRMATINPAKVLGIEKQKGALSVGADADITVFTPTGEVVRTIIGGVVN